MESQRLKKCSVAALGMISNVFGNEIFSALMPFVEFKLSLLDDASCKEREGASLALGGIAESCINCLYPHFS
ncbi:putative armadillo-like helical protein [Helianthus anomalus]